MSEYTTDEQIAAQVLRVPEMFGFLIDRYEKKLDRYILRKTSLDYDLRQDILQEVFLKSYQNIASFDPKLSFNSWIYRICHNTIINDWKKNKRYREGVSFDSEASDYLLNLFSEESTVHEVDVQYDSKRLGAALDSLKGKYRDIVILRYAEELSYDEIADVLKLPPGTVATNLSRAKKKLRTLLDTK